MVIGTDEISSFVFFNYEWITWITHLDNYEGLNGPPAYVRYFYFEFEKYEQLF